MQITCDAVEFMAYKLLLYVYSFNLYKSGQKIGRKLTFTMLVTFIFVSGTALLMTCRVHVTTSLRTNLYLIISES